MTRFQFCQSENHGCNLVYILANFVHYLRKNNQFRGSPGLDPGKMYSGSWGKVVKFIRKISVLNSISMKYYFLVHCPYLIYSDIKFKILNIKSNHTILNP